jgi:hypothetical protein
MIKDTVYGLEIHLQRVDEKMAQLTTDTTANSSSTVDLKDEKEVTQQCLRICEDAGDYIASLTNQECALLHGSKSADENIYEFEAQTLTRQALEENQDHFAMIISQLRGRLETLVLKNDPDDGNERSRLLNDINTSKQCLEVCRVASEVSSRKEYRVGEVIADGESDQVVVNTLADIFDVKKATSLGNSAQLVGSMTEEALRDLTEKRYNSRFGAPPLISNDTHDRVTRQYSVSDTQKLGQPCINLKGSEGGSVKPKARYSPSSNEVRKRSPRDDNESDTRK